jgi:hypothetical protein
VAVPLLDANLFAGCWISYPLAPPGPDCPCADLNQNGMMDYGDLTCFLWLAINGTQCTLDLCNGSSQHPMMDCDGNGEPDLIEVIEGVVPDCNGNLIPDSCDLNVGDPDGNGQVSSDYNSNSIPDECDTDCQPNGLPDDYEIQERLVSDANSNGIPDECEE